MDKPSTPHGNRRHPDAGTPDAGTRNLRAHNVRTPSWSGNGPVGTVTRGTTGINRLRRCDRWVVHNADLRHALLRADRPLAVDVGYGASWTTTCEWAARLRTI
ncbi:MAG: class I SAM-dependent methyltransferase, partial [Corynebacterium sp.]|nr:class I SAM-dependent methyltransferase [Corynebacterium sp.]